MKKRKLFITAFCVVILSCPSVLNLKAATEISENEGEDSVLLEDGTKIYYSSELNGGIDLVNTNNYPLIEKNKQIKLPAKYLNIAHQTQNNGYYCGPAAASMIVKALGFNKSQSQMASILKTSSSTGTEAGDVLASRLNSVTSSKATFRWQWHDYRNVSTIENHIIQAINYGNGVMVNTMESAGDYYLKGHGWTTTLYHYGVIRGYNSLTGVVSYLDPGAGMFSGFVKEQFVTWDDISKATGGRGYAW